MKRSDFLRNLGIGLGVATITPQLLTAQEPEKKGEPVSLAIDINSISNITMGGHQITPAEILQIYQQTGFLLYHSYSHRGVMNNAPIVIKGKIEVIDISKLRKK